MERENFLILISKLDKNVQCVSEAIRASAGAQDIAYLA
jgi:hypothetical protein